MNKQDRAGNPAFPVPSSRTPRTPRTPRRIAIVKLSSLGDIVHTLPAFHQLRERFPQAHISWLVEPLGAKLLENFPALDEIIPVHLKVPGMYNKLKQLRKILSQYRGTFDLVLDFQGLIKSAALAFLLKGTAAGFHGKNCREPLARLFYRYQARPFDENLHVIYKNLHLVNCCAAAGNSGDVPVYPKRRVQPAGKELVQFLEAHRLLPGKYIIINVGGGWASKLLSVEQFIAVIKGWRGHSTKTDPVVMLWGNEEERARAEKIAAATVDLGVVPVIFLGFADLLHLIEKARLIVSGDTLALHLADLVNTPSVGIFGPTSPQRNGSLLAGSIAVYENLPCNFCYKKKCDKIECLKKISIEKIITSIEIIDEKCN